jgi:IPT/TIG domain
MSAMHAIRLAVLLLIATSAFASPVITSVAPNQGSVFGGTMVVIRGTGFSDNCVICSPPFGGLSVEFGGTPATDVELINPTLIFATSPIHVPGTVDVKVNQMDGSDPNFDVAENAFTYLDEPLEALEAVLFPIFTPPVNGAFGAVFHTTARVASRGQALDLYGVDTNCTLIDPPLDPTRPYRVGASESVLLTSCSESAGRLFYVARDRVDDLVANLRVTDVTRNSQSHGVEIPVVREDDFTTIGKVVLLGVPIDPRFRNTLRIYGLRRGPQEVHVTVNGVTHPLTLQMSDNLFEPSFATFTAFPTAEQLPPDQRTVTVTIQDPLGGRGIAGATPFWAFVSVTNNETQQITTITPN